MRYLVSCILCLKRDTGKGKKNAGMHCYLVEIGCRARKEEIILLTPVVQTHHFTYSVSHYY